jgi:hypothetical protein
VSDAAERVEGRPAFLIGAGFNSDASQHVEDLRESVKYPTGNDLARIAFGEDLVPEGSSIEEWFQQAIDEGNPVPLEKMCEAVLKADYYLTEGLLGTALKLNPYLLFLEKFPDSDFLTFNYDGLIEILLLHQQRWTPADGFGMSVRSGLSAVDRTAYKQSSPQLVVHLHGSLYIYARESDLSASDRSGVQWLTLRKESDFVFDPDSTAHRFFPFKRLPVDQNYKRTHERIIAPIPDKTIHLKQEFVEKSYCVAESVVQRADRIICIGYNFNNADRDSFAPILNLAKRRGLRITVVAPNARSIVRYITDEFRLSAEAYSGTFAAWVQGGFPGSDTSSGGER